MSDPEPSVTTFSSSPPLSTQTSESAAALNYAFLVHSQKTLTQNLPPRVDNKLLARQKRRRTSPEDHAVLEAEYQRNPKPDKTARANIVSRVTLGEKEVQIWFQNRRQNDRRKSKPLQPHELLAPRVGADALKQTSSDDNGPSEPGSSSGNEQNDDSIVDHNPGIQCSDNGSLGSDGAHADRHEGEQPLLSSQTSLATTTEIHGDSKQTTSEAPAVPEAPQSQDSSQQDELQPHSAKRKRSATNLREEMLSGPVMSTPDGAQHVKSPPSLRISMSFDGEAMVRKEGELTPSPPKGRNALRIAMSSDGKAVIRADGEPSPSKNRISMFSSRKPRFAGLRRSNSAVVLGTPRSAPEKERPFGRSRDPRNWESFVDTDARSALSTPSGSQSTPNTGSPGLFRSGSQRSLTRSFSGRQNNSYASEYLNTPVPQEAREKRRKISRTVSSLGRLETGRNALHENPTPYSVRASKILGNISKDDEDLEFHGDSDKENWVPGTRMSHIRRQGSNKQTQRPALREANGRENKFNKSLTSGKRSRLSQASQRKLNLNQGKDVPGVDPDVSAFMAGGGSASQDEDLDCIQGLLSLSQGAWR
ncbi:putative homeobox transcription factor [Aspergillus campestris IBT 28561]|uniref:Homeobox transcription factor n=1 Tax=Aspergillus campestris (strain IBT 28561) TaxID=1392248 RepID=A0A2I1DEK2_ASPC2|nr:putative homeobox transcription factor [Aspergillus campestris IBT 28561]PKY08305.1 putative homeobox transcription factor [Aspergillus campestris IBT 28561]